MARKSKSSLRSTAKSIADRLGERSIPTALKPYATAFLKLQGAYESAAAGTDSAETSRAAALEEVRAADAVLDGNVDKLVDLLPGAGLGTRQQPLKGFSRYSPSDLKALPYAKEPDEVAKAVAAINAKKPPASVVAAGKVCLASGAVVKAKLKVFGSKLAAYVQVLARREGLSPDLTKALDSLKIQAAAAWEKDKPTFKAVFAKPARVEAPMKKRPKKKTVTNGSAAVAANGSPAVTSTAAK